MLTNKDRKPLLLPESRYQNFLRATFSRTVLFSGFDLDDPDLIELLEDVSRGFNGHVPPNLALVPAGATEPSTALRASMHYGTQLIEYPADRSRPTCCTSWSRCSRSSRSPSPPPATRRAASPS